VGCHLGAAADGGNGTRSCQLPLACPLVLQQIEPLFCSPPAHGVEHLPGGQSFCEFPRRWTATPCGARLNHRDTWNGCLSEENLRRTLGNRRPNARALRDAASAMKIRESLPPDLSSLSCECHAVFDYRVGPRRQALKVVPRLNPTSVLRVRSDTWGATTVGMIVVVGIGGEFLGKLRYRRTINDVASDRQSCVQSRQRVSASQDANRVEIGVLSRNASKRQFVGLHSSAEARCSSKGTLTQKLLGELELIGERYYSDIQVSKTACSRRELNVSNWGILWHSVSGRGTRKLLITQVNQ
jgi:hypothetical protein